MATQIAEPNDIPSGSITDETANNYEILVYQKAQDNAGIKRMAIAGWKTYLNYDSGKTGRLASFIGVDPDYHWDDPTAGDYSGTKVTQRIQALSDKIGLNTEPAVVTETLLDKVTTLQNEVETTDTGLLDRVTNIEDTIGTPSGGSGTLTSRITALETTVDGDGSVEGLVTKVGTNTTNISSIEDQIGDVSTPGTIIADINKNATDISTINTTLGDGTTAGVLKDISDLQGTVGDSTSGLVKQVNKNTTDISDLKQTVSTVYNYQGNVTGVDDPANTTKITVNGNLINLSDLKTGYTYNVSPTSGDSITMTINGTQRAYTKGANIAWVGGSTNDFDELGTTINVSDYENLKQDVQDLTGVVTVLSTKFHSESIPASGSWDSATKLNNKPGVYQISATSTTGSPSCCCFIVMINSSGYSITPAPIADLSTNFSTYFSIDSNTYNLSLTNTSVPRKISYIKIGEV